MNEDTKTIYEIKEENILQKKEYLYARNPYILDKDIIITSHKNRHILPFRNYVLEENKNRNTGIGFVLADMPAEFDYPWEFEETKKCLDSIIK